MSVAACSASHRAGTRRGQLPARVPGPGARKAHPAPLAAAERPHDDLERQAENDQVGDHLSGHHQPGRVALGGDVTEPHGGEDRDREIQPVRVGQMPTPMMITTPIAMKNDMRAKMIPIGPYFSS